MRAFALSKIPPLSSPGLKWETLALHPTVDLELGAGAGLHAIRHAQGNPDRVLVAIERTTKAERMHSRRIAHNDLINLFTLRADAIHWVASEVPAHSIDQCFILYPNPYPKSRNKNLRWHNMPFMGFLKSRLKPNGKIITATNESYYAEEAKRVMTATWGFKLLDQRQILMTERPRTHFEKKYLARNEACWNLVFENTASSWDMTL